MPPTPHDRELLDAAMCAAGRTLADPVVSPDGVTVAMVVSFGSTVAVVAVPADGGPEVIVSAVVPARPHPMGGGVLAWTPAADALVLIGADGGLWFQPMPGGPARPLLSPDPDGRSLASVAMSPDGRRVAVSRDDREILVVPLDAGPPVVLSAGHDFALDPTWLDASTVVWHAWSVPDMAWDHSLLVAASADGGGAPWVVVDHGAQVAQPRGFDGRLVHLDDHQGWLNVYLDGVALVHESFEHGSATWGPGVRTVCWSPDGRQVAFTRNEGGFGRLCVVSLDDGVVTEVAKAVHVGLSWGGGRLVAVRTGGVTPHCLVSYDTTTWQRTVLARGPVSGLEAALVEPELVTFAADDGSLLHGRLYRCGEGPAPLVCWLHGGPIDQWQVTCIARVGYFVSRGYHVLVPDHRGSTGHGRAYAQALNGHWGVIDVDDTAAAIRAALDRGWTDGPAAVMGGSAGGFSALAVAAHHPELVAAVVALYPVTSLATLASATHRFEAHAVDRWVGTDPVALAERSPISQVHQLRAPVLLLHGDQDKVVPVDDSLAYVAALSAAGGTVQSTIMVGEGHGWKRPESVHTELRLIEQFLAEQLS